MLFWVPLSIILAALISIGDGKITPSHWAFRCETAVVMVTEDGQEIRVVKLGMNADGTMAAYAIRESDCKGE